MLDVNNGFTQDEVDSTNENLAYKATIAGYSASEISAAGIKNRVDIQILGNSNRFETITPRLNGGQSPLLTVNGYSGSFNFDVDPIIDQHKPGKLYEFNTNDGQKKWFQLEKEFQGEHRWEQQKSAESMYNEYKNWPPLVRKNRLEKFWENSPEVAAIINESIDNDVPFEEVKKSLEDLSTFRQISTFDIFNEDIETLLTEYGEVPFIDRILNPEDYPIPDLNEDGSISTHLISAELDKDGKAWVFPQKIINENGEYVVIKDKQKALEIAKKSGNAIYFDSIEKAEDFSINYKTAAFENYEKFVTTKVIERLLENGADGFAKKGYENLGNFQVPDDFEMDKTQMEGMELLRNYLQKANEDPSVLEQEIPWGEIPEISAKNSSIGLLLGLLSLEDGDVTSAENYAKFWLKLQSIENQTWLKKRAFGIAGITSELPLMIPAGISGAMACRPPAAAISAVGAASGHPVVAGVASVASGAVVSGCAYGAAFAAPAFFRTLLTDLIEADIGVTNDKDMLQILQHAFKEGGKELVVGLLTGGVGSVSRYAVQAMGAGKVTTWGTGLLAESATMTAAHGYVHNYMPTFQDFIDTTVEISIFSAGMRSTERILHNIKRKIRSSDHNIYKNLVRLYRETGIHPSAVKDHLAAHPELVQSVKADLAKDNFIIPSYYLKMMKEVMTRVEQVSESHVQLQGKEIKLHKYFNPHKNIIEINAKETVGGEATKLTLELVDGSWIIRGFDGKLDQTNIKTIADYLETNGRTIEHSKEFEKISKIIADREKPEVEKIDPEYEALYRVLKEAEIQAEKLMDSGEKAMAEEVLTTAKTYVEETLGKEFSKDIIGKVEDFVNRSAERELKETQVKYYKETGFLHPSLITDKIFENIERLEIKKHDVETHIVARHATDQAVKIHENGFDVRQGNGFLHFGSDIQADARQMPHVASVQIILKQPLDTRRFPEFDAITDGLKNISATINFLRRLNERDPNDPAGLTKEQFDSIRNQSVQQQSEALAQILLAKGYDSVIYRNTEELSADGKSVGGDSVAVLVNENIKALGWSSSKDQAGERLYTENPEVVKNPQEFSATGGFNLKLIDQSPQAEKIMAMPELVELVSQLMDGQLPIIAKNLGEGTLGTFVHRKGTEDGWILLRAEIAKNPKLAHQVMAHEIGHMIDWLDPGHTMSRGNILGRIAALKDYLNSYLEGRPDGLKPLTKKELDDLKKQATKIIKDLEKELKEDTVDVVGMTPQQIKDMATGVLKRADIDPQIYHFYQSASRELKKEITRAAMRGEVWHEIKRLEQKAEIHPESKDLKEKIRQKYEELLVAEIKRRGLLSKETITNELKALTHVWRPFNPQYASPKYIKYRYSSKELYADFFSAIMTNPSYAQKVAPTAYEGFFNWLENKPKFKKVYDDIQRTIYKGENLDVVEKRLIDAFNKGDNIKLEAAKEKLKNDKLFKGKGVDWATQFIDQYWKVISDETSFKHNSILSSESPTIKISEYRHKGTEFEGYVKDTNNRIIAPLAKQGVSTEQFGLYLFYRRVINERSELFNPRGVTKDTAKLLAERMEEKNPDLAYFANEYAKVRKEWIIDEIKKSGMFSPLLVNKIVSNDAYVKFDVIEHINNNYGEGTGNIIFGQIGTLKDITNPLAATLAYDTLILSAIRRNSAVNATLRFYEEANRFEPDLYKFEPAKKTMVGKQMQYKAPSDPNLQLLTVMRNGELLGFYVEKNVATMFDPLYQGGAIGELARSINAKVRTLFTDANPGFWLMNFSRDYQRTVKNLPSIPGWKGKVPLANHVAVAIAYTQALAPSFRRVYGISDATIKSMEKNNELISIVNRTNDHKEGTEIERILFQWHRSPKEWREHFQNPFERIVNEWLSIGQLIETQGKVAGRKYLDKYFPNMPEAQKSEMIRTLSGSPDFLRRGTMNYLYNNLFLYANAAKEGWRGDIRALKDRPGEYIYKTIQTNLIPKVMMYAAAEGVFGDDIKSCMAAATDYDKTNYTVIPLALAPKDKCVYLRIPNDETGRFMGGVFWKMFTEDEVNPLTPIDLAGGQLPSVSPVITTAWQMSQFANDINPYDFFRNKNVINEQVWEAGGVEKNKAMLGHISNNLGGSILYRVKTDQLDLVKTELEEVLGLPLVGDNILGRFIKVSNAGSVQSYRDETDDLKQKSARENLVVNKAISKMQQNPNYKLNNEEIEALATKELSLDSKYLRILVKNFGTPIADALLNASSVEERVVILKKVKEEAADGNIFSQRFLEGEKGTNDVTNKNGSVVMEKLFD